MTWISDFAIQAREEDDNRDRREKAYEQHMWGVWSSLVSRIREDVETINKDSYLVKNRLMGEPLKFEEQNGSSFKVSRMVIPSAYLIVTNRHRYFEVERTGRKSVDSQLSHEPLEKIQVEPGEDFNLYMSIERVGALNFSEISQHLLQPMLKQQVIPALFR